MEAKIENQTLEEIRTAGLKALLQHLGVVGMIRFLQYGDKGSGDYTKERYAWLEDTDLDKIADEIKKS